jgi:hypothetical protein
VKMNMLFEGADSVEPCETDLFGYFVWCSAAWTSRARPLCTGVAAGQGTALFVNENSLPYFSWPLSPEIEGGC